MNRRSQLWSTLFEQIGGLLFFLTIPTVVKTVASIFNAVFVLDFMSLKPVENLIRAIQMFMLVVFFFAITLTIFRLAFGINRTKTAFLPKTKNEKQRKSVADALEEMLIANDNHLWLKELPIRLKKRKRSKHLLKFLV